jgi:hypothetical protein
MDMVSASGMPLIRTWTKFKKGKESKQVVLKTLHGVRAPYGGRLSTRLAAKQLA